MLHVKTFNFCMDHSAGIRSRQLPDSRIMVRTLRPFQILLCASPAHLEKRGMPTCPRDLSGHIGIGFRYPQ